MFWLAVFLTLYFTLRPVTAPSGLSDKTEHLLAFGGLAGLAALAHPSARLLPLGAALAGLGAAIELIQPLVGRSDDLQDWYADTLGVVIGLMPIWAGRRFGRRAERTDQPRGA